MKSQKTVVVLTVINLLVLSAVLFVITVGFKSEDKTILRGSGFELIDESGRIRAEIKIMPAEPDLKMPDGTTGYPESVLFRLFDSEGGPNVKIVATEDGSGLVLGGESGYVQILSRTSEPIVKLSNKNGKEQIIEVQ